MRKTRVRQTCEGGVSAEMPEGPALGGAGAAEGMSPASAQGGLPLDGVAPLPQPSADEVVARCARELCEGADISLDSMLQLGYN